MVELVTAAAQRVRAGRMGMEGADAGRRVLLESPG
jgi:hypothetical protein